MALNLLLKIEHLVLGLLLGYSDELAQFDELFLVLGHLADALLHVVKGGGDLLDGVTAPLVDTFDQSLLDGGSLFGKTTLQIASSHLKDGVVDHIVGDVEDFVLSIMVLVEHISNYLEWSLLLKVLLSDGLVEEVLDEALLVDIEDVFVLLVLIEESLWGDLVVKEHTLDLLGGVNEPWEFVAKLKRGLLRQAKESDEVFL